MPRCLIVDDHDDGRDGFREYLESFGFEVKGTSTAEDALEFMIAGASAIQVGTASFYDPGAAMKIIDGLVEYCRGRGIEQIGSLIGSVQFG